MRRILAALALAALSACATASGPEAAGRFDRFEGDAVAVAGFDRVFVAPVAVAPEVEARLDLNRLSSIRDDERPLGQRDIDRNTAALAEAVRREVGAAAPLADAPGPGVLTIALTLTGVDANRPTMAEQTANPALSFQSIALGGASVTGELREGDAVLARFTDESQLAQINDPAIGAGMWVEADRYYRQLGNKLAGLLR